MTHQNVEMLASELHNPQVKVVRMREDVKMPLQAHPSDAGFDLHSTQRVDVPSGCSMLVGTGLRMEIPHGWCGQINPRSGIASKHQVTVGARVIDAGFRSEVMINLINHGPETFEVVEGMRIAQILFLPVLGNIVEVTAEELSETPRGNGGFGSTGDK